jgi:N-acetylmuramoyl-L-alanine amidase
MPYKVYLDAGHGGQDSGASGNGLKEKDITLKIILLIEKLLKNYQNVETKLTRRDDTYVSLSGRTNAANKWGADLFLSVHIDSSAHTQAEGRSSFTYTEASAKSKAFQNVLHKEIGTTCSFFYDRGQRQQNFHVVRESTMPAVLTESGFISNAGDSSKLKQEANIAAIAAGHVNGIAKFLGLKPKEPEDMEDFKGHWAEAAIRDMMQRGIMHGYSDGSFKPDQPVTRGEIAVLLQRVLNQGGTAK